jgi:hypothetical protein
MNIQELLEELYKNNKYLIKFYNTVDNNWTIYMYKNQHIQLDIQTPSSLSSSYIDTDKALQYIENQESSIKIKYNYYYDDYEAYIKLIENILENIKAYYLQKDKEIIVKRKFYY